MPNDPRDVEIETVKTPKGDVPTIKGLESAINIVYAEMTSLDKELEEIRNLLSKITIQVSDQNQKISMIGESLAKLIVHLAKTEAQQEKKRELTKQKLSIEKADLIALKEDLSRILAQLEDHVVKNES
jgi:DNA repair ATPase RecN